TVLLVLCGTVPLYWRRIHPLAVGIVVVGAEIAALFIGMGGMAFLGSVVAVYSIGAHTAGVLRTRVMSAIVTAVLLLFVAGWIDGLSLLEEFVSTGALLITAFVLGDNLRRRREHVDGLAERAERAERERELLAEQRVVAERTRIARDLHDVVAHSVSVMVIQAAAARRNLTSSPEQAAEAIEAIESTGRQTMGELRSILGVLRAAEPDASLAPQPSLSRLESFAGLDGLPLTVTVEGDLTALPESVSATGYRLIQEALTNVRRHAGSVDRVTVALRVDGDDVRIEIVDDGRGAGALPDTDGFGLIGMRERVAAVGGTVEAGPQPGGGWRVRAVLPIDTTSSHRLMTSPS
ncbi:MAG TPA: sensor histidine kinase, partial [Ilumatobacteraceae bacterium]|nr:sensor histidine kinase [Ilumatobacteraceae bacterium]